MTFERKISRRTLLKLGGVGLAGASLGSAYGQSAGATPAATPERIRIGMVLPTTTGVVAVRAATYQLAADAAKAGALMAEEEFGADAEAQGKLLEVRVTTAPDTEAAIRAAERLTSVEEVFAFAGGFGQASVQALSELAAQRQLPFLNLGSDADALRGAQCNRYTFHVEASAAMYLDALTGWFASESYKRWFYVYTDDEAGRALYARAQAALAEHGAGSTEVAAVAVDPQAFNYTDATQQIQDSDADVVLLLLDAVSQLSFMGELENIDLKAQVTGLPDATAQTRSFLVAAKNGSPKAGIGYRAALWEARLEANGAARINQRFRERWGFPMDGPAWAGYQTVKMLYEATKATESQEADTVIGYLENPNTTFDLEKGQGTSFRAWDHQLRQPLYMIQVNEKAENAFDLANLVATLPTGGEGDAIARLDTLGDTETDSNCKL